VLFVNPTHTHGFEGMTTDDAVRLIEELRDHATQERFVYYHAWRVGDVVMWDEIATMHRGAADARPEERRIMLRPSCIRTIDETHERRATPVHRDLPIHDR
jgi:alpha-ketoglutarate-dependent taurine dioxygenase